MAVAEIGLEDLRISCIIGDTEEERQAESEIFATLTYEHGLDEVAQSDRLEDTVDYVSVAELCTRIAVEGKFFLIETLAARMTDALMAAYPIGRIRLKLRKPGCLANCRAATVELVRERS